jgi:hypothetical protein
MTQKITIHMRLEVGYILPEGQVLQRHNSRQIAYGRPKDLAAAALHNFEDPSTYQHRDSAQEMLCFMLCA